MTTAPAWFERKFTFDFPVEQFPNLCVRLLGAPARLEELISKVPPATLTHKPSPNDWSAQEHAGHLADMEGLWLARFEDFVAGAPGQILTPADLTNRKTHEANHNARPLAELLADFRRSRAELLHRLRNLQPEQAEATLLHPRLQQPMRLVDHLFFVAEHDDHHLAQIYRLIG